jgi:hypothetical protein
MRVFIAKELPSLIRDVEISEAVEYVLPLMNSLGTDPGLFIIYYFLVIIIAVNYLILVVYPLYLM